MQCASTREVCHGVNSYEIDVLVPLSFLRCACLLLVAHWFTGGHAVAVIALIYIFLLMVFFLPSLDATSCSKDAIEAHLERLQSLVSRYLMYLATAADFIIIHH